MMSAMVSLERDQQHLIDLRLDSLDRILMDSGVARPERSEIVQSIEDQIFEMLDQQGEEVSREAVLELLRSLDPPEAYWTEGSTDSTARVARGVRRDTFDDRHSLSARTHDPYSSKYSGFAITSFVLAMISIPTIILLPLGSLLSIVSLTFGLIAFPSISASRGRLRGRWMAIFGCTVFGLHVAAFLLLIAANM